MPGKLKWAPFGPTCIKLYDLKLGIIRGIINEHVVAIGTVKTLLNSLSSSWIKDEAYPGSATANAKRCLEWTRACSECLTPSQTT